MANQKPRGYLLPMTIRYNGSRITLTKNGTSIVIRDKHGAFVGMRELHTVLEALEEALATGELDLPLCEVEREQQQLNFSVRLQK